MELWGHSSDRSAGCGRSRQLPVSCRKYRTLSHTRTVQRDDRRRWVHYTWERLRESYGRDCEHTSRCEALVRRVGSGLPIFAWRESHLTRPSSRLICWIESCTTTTICTCKVFAQECLLRSFSTRPCRSSNSF